MRSLLEYPRQGTTRSKIRVTPLGRQAHIYFYGQYFPTQIIDDIERPKTPPAEQTVTHKIDRPAAINRIG